jgi:predicted small secreted protein
MKNKILLALAALLFASVTLVGCNAGESNIEDIKAQNQKIDEAAKKEPNRGGGTSM